MVNILLFLCLAGQMGSNPDQDLLIKQLGDDGYLIRERATEQLIALGYPAITKLEETLKTSEDLEIKSRCEHILNQYYIESMVDLHSIWCLPREYRFVLDEDLAEYYYLKARKDLNETASSDTRIPNYIWNDETANFYATQLYYKDKLVHADCRENVKIIKNKSVELQAKLDQKMNNDCFFYDFNKPPGPIEDYIESTTGIKETFKEAMLIDFQKYFKGLLKDLK